MKSAHTSRLMSGFPVAIPARTVCKASVASSFVMAMDYWVEGKTGVIECIQLDPSRLIITRRERSVGEAYPTASDCNIGPDL